MRRPVLLALLLPLLVVPTGAAQACDTTQVETLATELPAAPATVRAGRRHTVAVTVTRAGRPAADVDLFAALRGASFDDFADAVTSADGTAVLVLEVPAGARGRTELEVEAYRAVLELPCATVEEHDATSLPWGQVRA